MKVVIVDDEKDNIETLIWELEQQELEIEVVETFTSSIKAYEYLSKNMIDALFLDIQMPKMNGFELLSALGKIDCHVVFVTAYDNFAIEAFKHNALDYILKPIDSEDLSNALEKLQNEVDSKSFFSDKLKNLFTTQNIIKKIPLNIKNTIVLVELDHLIYLEGNGNYTNIYYKVDGKLTLNISSKTLKTFEDSLEPSLFIKTHRSFIVNRNEIKELFYDQGKAFLRTNDDVTIPISRSNKEMVFDLLA